MLAPVRVVPRKSTVYRPREPTRERTKHDGLGRLRKRLAARADRRSGDLEHHAGAVGKRLRGRQCVADAAESRHHRHADFAHFGLIAAAAAFATALVASGRLDGKRFLPLPVLALVILLSVLAGLVFASCVGLLRHWKLRSRIRQLEAKLAAQERPGTPTPPAKSLE